MQRRDFLKRIGLTLGVSSASGTALVVASPGSNETDKHLIDKRQMFEGIYNEGRTPESIIDEPLESLPYFDVNENYENETSLNPGTLEYWASEGLRILQENMTLSKMVGRDFTNSFGAHGDVVNVRYPRLQRGDVVVNAVVLNHIYSQFIISDRDSFRSIHDLCALYLYPAMYSFARYMDMEVYSSFVNEDLVTVEAHQATHEIIRAVQYMDENFTPKRGRKLAISPKFKGSLMRQASYKGEDTLYECEVRMSPVVQQSLAFHHADAVHVCRPLPPRQMPGVQCYTAIENDLSLRTTMYYDMAKQGTVFCFDMLSAAALLNRNPIKLA